MSALFNLVRRNVKMYFKDKGMFFSSLITPLILLVLYATFLANVYRESFTDNLPDGFTVPEKLINGMVGGELVSSLLAVCCITVAFCSNLIVGQDKVSGARRDLLIAPVKQSTLSLSYYLSTAAATLIVCFTATAVSFIYLAFTGWYLGAADVLAVMADVVLLVLFGTALASIVNNFLSTEGQMTAVGTIVSAGYGFVCGAYMPISQFGEGLRNGLMFLPGTYGTSLLRNHSLGGTFSEMIEQGFPQEVVEGIKDSVDCNIYFFGNRVETGVMYAVLAGSIAILIGVYVAINVIKIRKRRPSAKKSTQTVG